MRLYSYFPEYEIYVRVHGRLRFLKITTDFQVKLASAVLAGLLIWLMFSGGLIFSQYQVQAQRSEIAAKARAVARESSKVEAFRETFDSKTRDLEARQAHLERIARKYFGPGASGRRPQTDKPASDKASSETARNRLDEAERLSRLQHAQLDFTERMTRLAMARTRRTEAVLHRLGLNPGQLAGPAAATGGPLVPFDFYRGDRDNDRLLRLGAMLDRLDSLERALLAAPTTMPVENPRMTSAYGFRFDPFTRWPAMHAGQDFGGKRGDPIHAAGSGIVIHAGWSSGYGNLVVVDHGRGISTAYGHMSSIDAKLEDRVGRGQIVGRMGSTGRSTSDHLHFEVRVNGRAINPRRFLEGAVDVAEIQNRIKQRLVPTGGRS